MKKINQIANIVTLGIGMIVFIYVLSIIFMRTDNEGATKALIDSGYHPIKVGGYGWAMCSDDDLYRTMFTAYSPDSSRIVEGCVCEGVFKGKTIRLK